MAGRGSAGSEAHWCAHDTFQVAVGSWEGINQVLGDGALTCTEGMLRDGGGAAQHAVCWVHMFFCTQWLK